MSAMYIVIHRQIAINFHLTGIHTFYTFFSVIQLTITTQLYERKDEICFM